MSLTTRGVRRHDTASGSANNRWPRLGGSGHGLASCFGCGRIGRQAILPDVASADPPPWRPPDDRPGSVKPVTKVPPMRTLLAGLFRWPLIAWTGIFLALVVVAIDISGWLMIVVVGAGWTALLHFSIKAENARSQDATRER